jgi:subtilisin family serine protease
VGALFRAECRSVGPDCRRRLGAANQEPSKVTVMKLPKRAVAHDAEYYYSNPLNGKTYRFRPKDDEAVVTFQPEAADVAAVMSAVRSSPLELTRGINAKQGFAVIHTPPGVPAAALPASATLPGVLNQIPVMIDQEGLTRFFLPDELTIQFRDGVDDDEALRTIAKLNSEVLKRQRTRGYFTVTVPEGKGLFETLRAASKLPNVAFAEPSEAGFDDALAHIPSDPHFHRLWGLRNTGQTVNGTAGTAGADIRATLAWEVNRGAANVVVAVIDTGADLDHPDLADNLLPRGSEDWDFADEDDPVPEDSGSHGSHVAGTVAAVENASGIVGVAPRCRLMPLRINLTSGMNQNRADAINYVADQANLHPERRYVVNCSWRTNGDHAGVHNAIINAVSNNVVVVFAAGNDNRDTDVMPQYPGVYPEVISVAALDQRDARAAFSNFGRNVDVSAPGVNIWSSIPNDTHGFSNGTSMAAPHVAGLAALIWSTNLSLTNAQIRLRIERSCDSIDRLNPGFEGRLGFGRINAARALGGCMVPLLHTLRV